MKAFYQVKHFFTRKTSNFISGFYLFALIFFSSLTVSAQCPTPVITAPTICAGQQPELILTLGAPASAGPFSLVINGATYPSVTPGIPFPKQASEDNLFGAEVPLIPAFADATLYELGVKFTVSTNGFIKGIRFYKSALSNGPFTGTLWTQAGIALATGTFTVVPGSEGWQELRFTTPVSVSTGQVYVASYSNPTGLYAFEAGRFATTPVVSAGGFLTAPASGGPAGSNGVFRPGSAGFPTQSFNSANYFVDAIFSPLINETVFDLTSITGPGCAETGSPISTATIVVNPLPTGTISSPSTPIAGQSHNLLFTAGAGTGPYSLNINGSPISGVSSGTPFNAGVVPLFSDYRLWTGTLPTPPTVANDGLPVEAGMKFKPGFDGSITALRFYKGIPNTETIVLNLYSAAGALLATTNYTDATGTVTGFVEVPITPVAVTSGTLYMVSYYSALGNYVFTSNYMTIPRTNGLLTAVATGSPDGPNGMYKYAAGFPDQFCAPCNGVNYWADVVMNSINLSQVYQLSSITDGNGCTSPVSQLLTLSVNNPLPVSLVKFSGINILQDVKLEWSTASESNNRGFEVERSTDAVKWLNVGFVAGNGNSNTTKNYSLTDRNLPAAKYFYRLKQVDFDGKFNYSNILSVDVNGKLSYELNQSFPNPSRGSSTINYSIPVKTQVVLAVYDMQGRVVSVLQNGERAAGKYAVTVPANLLKPGVYYYKLEAGDFKSTRKMIVQ